MVSVAVNGRTVVHRKSDGVSLAFPDPCITPPLNAPIPYANVALSADAADTSVSVFCDGEAIMLASSSFATSSGDEPGSGGGVVSGCTRGKASFTNYSFDVSVEGEPVPRAFDPMSHNHRCPGNGASPAEHQSDTAAQDLALLCVAFCFCNFKGGKQGCFNRVLAEPIWIGMPTSRRYWRPYLPGLFVEVPYDMTTVPPRPYMSEHFANVGGVMTQLPAGDRPPITGSKRPDVVAVWDPYSPPVGANIRNVYEVKFPGDYWREGQWDAYARINNGKPPVHINAAKCGCTGQEVPICYPLRQPGEVPEDEVEDAGDPAEELEPTGLTGPLVPVLALLFAMTSILSRGGGPARGPIFFPIPVPAH